MGFAVILAGAILILCSIAIIVIVSLQTDRGDGLSGAIMGGNSAGFGGRDKSNSDRLTGLTKILGVVFFVIAIAVGIVGVLVK